MNFKHWGLGPTKDPFTDTTLLTSMSSLFLDQINKLATDRANSQSRNTFVPDSTSSTSAVTNDCLETFDSWENKLQTMQNSSSPHVKPDWVHNLTVSLFRTVIIHLDNLWPLPLYTLSLVSISPFLSAQNELCPPWIWHLFGLTQKLID